MVLEAVTVKNIKEEAEEAKKAERKRWKADKESLKKQVG